MKLEGAVLAAPRLLVTPVSGATPSLRPKELKIAYPLSQECTSKTNIATSKTRSTLKWIGGYSGGRVSGCIQAQVNHEHSCG